MSEKMNLPERKLPQQGPAGELAREAAADLSQNSEANISSDSAVQALMRASIAHASSPDCKLSRRTRGVWPFTREHASPLAWWRTLPADLFGDAEHLLVHATLEGIAVLSGDSDLVPALRGDPAAATKVVLQLMPIADMTVEVDLVMTAVLRCALDGDARAALVLAHMLGRAELEHPFAVDLAASWLSRHRLNARGRCAYTRQEAALLSTLRDCDGAASRKGGPA
jgi:hypothetical protein